MKICLIDNYDSFTYNLEHQLRSFDLAVDVVRNDETSIDVLTANAYDAFVIGPGPSNPKNAGISMELIKHFYKTTPILGICLGHQCIGEAFDAEIVKCDIIKHGKTSMVSHNKNGLFEHIKDPYHVMRYHSLVIDRKTLSNDFEVTGWIKNGEENTIMAIQHNNYPLYGLQFHPESIFTDQGSKLVSNFIQNIK